MADRVVAYVDGFNLYFGPKADRGRKYLWLDLQALVERLLRTDQELRGVRYFTARVRDDRDAEKRQSIYLDALESYCPKVRRVEGRFQELAKELPILRIPMDRLRGEGDRCQYRRDPGRGRRARFI